MRSDRPARLPQYGIVVMALLQPSGCGYGPSSYPTSTTLTNITIAPPSETIVVGTTATLTAIGNYSNGTSTDISSSVSWSSTASAVAGVGATTGVVTGNAVGTATITASLNSGGPYGSGMTSAGDVVTVTAAALTGIAITPQTISVTRGATVTLTATGTFSDTTSGNISGGVVWTTSDATVATVNASGIATGVGVGTCTITATSGTVSNTATLTVM